MNRLKSSQVLINKNKEAYGVRFEKDGYVYDIRARKEVIVSGGSINSPQILMLSGIGPKEHLENVGIEVIADLRVGDNLQDHVGNVVLSFEAKHAEPIFWKEVTSPSNLISYKLHATGQYTSLCGIEGLAFLNTKYNDAKLDWPDAEIHLISASQAADYSQTFRQRVGLPEEGFESEDSDLGADSHSAGIRRTWCAVIGNQLAASGGFKTNGHVLGSLIKNSLLRFIFPGRLHPVASVVDVSSSVSRSPWANPNGQNRHDIPF
ncbi:Oxygen-dependent choline dehydrogenase [Araneus ventricosus]|uniref:Oxygen-dependent choline dehydrogenase n=1 Tax=Araneus ventricosus TaxID=182803 RepID=A0A4Y2CYX6_ARAVE|nr:Oxygen-dependent choline dehydrogenase [Araneus ventricosus]